MLASIKPHGLPTGGEEADLATRRCPGPTVQEIIGADALPPPAVLACEQPAYLGSAPVSVDRYFEQATFDAEIEKVWKKSWQWVCREDHIPEPGDYYTYEIAHLSYLVVRQIDGSVKGFVNSCLHRGTKFKRGEGIGSASGIQCPYHGWSWHNDGGLKAIPCAWDFGHVDAESSRLPEVRVGHWGGFVFINPSPDGPDLLEYLAPLPEHFATWDSERRFVEVHVAKNSRATGKPHKKRFLNPIMCLRRTRSCFGALVMPMSSTTA
jgi:nitrite reductase/ring-hydroxylating ferredoxin subunit